MKNDHIDLKSNQNIFTIWKFTLLLLYVIFCFTHYVHYTLFTCDKGLMEFNSI